MRYSFTVLTAILVAVLLMLTCQDAPSDQEIRASVIEGSTVTVSLLPARSEVAVGDKILFSIQVYANRSLSAADIELSFASQYVQVVAFGAGDALGPSPLRGIDHIDNGAGSARIALARVGPSDITGPVESTLATVMLEIVGSLADTNLSLSISQIELVDGKYNIISEVIANQAVLTSEQ